MDIRYNKDRIVRDIEDVRVDFKLDSFLFSDTEYRKINQKIDEFESFMVDVYNQKNSN